MIPILATLERHPDGVLTGFFRTLIVRAQIELRPLEPADGVRSYEAVAAPDFLFGAGAQAADDPLAPIDLALRAPKFPHEIRVRAVHQAGEVWSLHWLAS
jgi:uncharacterized protein (DUF736 family)